MTTTPDTQLAAVIVAIESASDIRRTLATLSRQTAAGQIELLLVAQDASVFDELSDAELRGFGRVERLARGRAIENVDVAAAAGIRAARSPYVAVVEDHVYLEPDWAEAMIRCHEENEACVGVGCEVALANRRSPLPIANHLFALSHYSAPVQPGPVPRVSRHHVVYKRDWLRKIDCRLESLLPRGGGMVELAAKDGGLVMQPDARLYHLTCGFWGESLRVRRASGQLKGSSGVVGGGLLKRLAATIKTPIMLWRRVRPQLKKLPTFGPLAFAVIPVTLLLLSMEAWGYLVGVWAGGGRAFRFICAHECRRERHVRQPDRDRLDRLWPIDGPATETVQQTIPTGVAAT